MTATGSHSGAHLYRLSYAGHCKNPVSHEPLAHMMLRSFVHQVIFSKRYSYIAEIEENQNIRCASNILCIWKQCNQAKLERVTKQLTSHSSQKSHKCWPLESMSMGILLSWATTIRNFITFLYNCSDIRNNMDIIHRVRLCVDFLFMILQCSHFQPLQFGISLSQSHNVANEMHRKHMQRRIFVVGFYGQCWNCVNCIEVWNRTLSC